MTSVSCQWQILVINRDLSEPIHASAPSTNEGLLLLKHPLYPWPPGLLEATQMLTMDDSACLKDTGHMFPRHTGKLDKGY